MNIETMKLTREAGGHEHRKRTETHGNARLMYACICLDGACEAKGMVKGGEVFAAAIRSME